MGRHYEGEQVIGVFNFSEEGKTVRLGEDGGSYVDLLAGEVCRTAEIRLPGYGFYYLKKL